MSKGTILFVDNNLDFLVTRSEHLTQNGYRVHCASRFSQALALFQKESVDLGVFDLRLQNDFDPSDLSGVQLAKIVSPYIPSIILTVPPNVSKVRLALVGHTGNPVVVDGNAKMGDPNALLQEVEETLRGETADR